MIYNNIFLSFGMWFALKELRTENRGSTETQTFFQEDKSAWMKMPSGLMITAAALWQSQNSRPE